MISLVGNRSLGVFGKRPSWALSLLLLSLIILVPLIFVILSSLRAGSENWNHIFTLLLPRYLKQTALLGAGVAAGTGVLGVWSAWILATYDFPGKGFFELFSFLPLAVPAYILAFVYADFFSISGPVYRNWGWSIDIMNMGGLIGVMTLALYPYIFAAARGSFSMQRDSLFEAARGMGVGPTRGFWLIALPMARPAIAAGISLVLMETFSEYGAVQYFGVENFTTGIFRAWFTLRDAPLALKLSGLLLIFTFGALYLESRSRGSSGRYASLNPAAQAKSRKKLTGPALALSVVVLSVPVSLGFFLPLGVLALRSISQWGPVLPELLHHLGQTALMGLTAALLTVITALLLAHGNQILRTPFFRQLTRLATLGYGIPGAVLALAVLTSCGGLIHGLKDQGIISLQAARFLILKGGFLSLLLAYTIRYLAVSYKPLEAHYQRMGHKLTEASLSLGYTPWQTLIRVNIPVLKQQLLMGSLLVFIDLIKELPITLILRPFNFETLATKAYYYAGNEMLSKGAPYSLIIITLGLIPTLMIANIRKKRRK